MRRFAWQCFALVPLALGTAGCGQAPARVQRTPEAERQLRIALNANESGEIGSIDIGSLSPAQLDHFARLDADGRATAIEVSMGDGTDPGLPPIAGQRSLADNALRFTPRYPFAPDQLYRVVVHLGEGPIGHTTADYVLTAEFQTPARAASLPTELAHIYPSSEALPENLLKFYLHFSGPMSRGEAYGHVHLLDADGHEVEAAFLELGEELWDKEQTRFTLLFDPGRVKRGLKPREDLGSVLEAGKEYTLAVDRDWPDAQGKPLVAGLRKTFRVHSADEAAVDVGKWTIESPAANTREALIVHFAEPLDQALLLRLLSVKDLAGKGLAGEVAVSDGETAWHFTPQLPWTAGDYQLLVETTLEDLAGNSIGRAFDVDTLAPNAQQITGRTIALPFSINGSPGNRR